LNTRTPKRRSVAPTYIALFAWILFTRLFPMYRLSGILLSAVLTFLIYLISKAIFKPKADKTPEEAPQKTQQTQQAQPEKKEPEKPVSYGEEVDAIIAEGRRAQQEMTRLYNSIREPSVRAKISRLMQVSDKIVEDAIHDPSDVPQIKKFLSYYLPTTIKLLNAYDRMDQQGVQGKNISGTMQSIEEMLDTAIAAYEKQLDSLFANQALDIETDISVMNSMLAREGLTGGDFK
jgi:5-bromo-4-chloroindolyl phosphate hydrolysis protein